MRIHISVNEKTHILYNKSMNSSKFGETLRTLRAEKHISQKQLSNIIGCSQSMLTRWEKGECEPTAPYIIVIADYFDVSTDEILGKFD